MGSQISVSDLSQREIPSSLLACVDKFSHLPISFEIFSDFWVRAGEKQAQRRI